MSTQHVYPARLPRRRRWARLCLDPADSLKPIATIWQWQMRGLCRTTGSELFFHPDNERGIERQQRDERAQQICNLCPVQRECLAHALTCREPYGVWGGTTETERRTATHRLHDTPTYQRGA